jgi:hypothetical protein
MRRRDFVRAGIAGAAVLGASAPEVLEATPGPVSGTGVNSPFKLNYAPWLCRFSMPHIRFRFLFAVAVIPDCSPSLGLILSLRLAGYGGGG